MPRNNDSVVVGNIGTVVFNGTHEEAEEAFKTYVEKSKNEEGRAAGEDVTWFKDLEIHDEHFGHLREEDDV